MKSIFFLFVPLLTLLASCSSTPESRIQKHPEVFLNLKPKQQKLVRQGKIDRGMPKSAVFLALGAPDTEVTRNDNGHLYTRWDYSVLVPVYTHYFGGFYGGYGRYGYCGPDYGFYSAPSVTYVPARGSSVYFKKGAVVGWEQINR